MAWIRATLVVIATHPAMPGILLLVLGLLVAVFLAWSWRMDPGWEGGLRLSGLFLQVIGYWMTVSNLLAQHRGTGRPTLRAAIGAALAVFPRFRPATISASMAAVARGRDTASGRASVWPGPNTPLEDRLRLLEDNLKALDGEVGILRRDLDQGLSRSEAAAREFQDRIDKRIDRVENEMKGLIGGGLGHAAWGVLVFAAGVVLSTASPELAAWIDGPSG